MCGVFLFAARSTSTALKSTHFPSGEGTGSPTRFSFIMSSKVKGCLAWENAGREKRRTKRKTNCRIMCLRGTKECSTGRIQTSESELTSPIAEVKPAKEICHPERSEGPLHPAHIFRRLGVLRFAQDDKSQS